MRSDNDKVVIQSKIEYFKAKVEREERTVIMHYKKVRLLLNSNKEVKIEFRREDEIEEFLTYFQDERDKRE